MASAHGIDIQVKRDVLQLELRTFANAILEQGDLLLNLWNGYIEEITGTLVEQLQSLNMDVVASLHMERLKKAEKLALVTTANADVEMADRTANVDMLINEKVCIQSTLLLLSAPLSASASHIPSHSDLVFVLVAKL